MQNNLPHKQRPSSRYSTDGFKRRPNTAHYQRRSSGILPATDDEYMISLGSHASRRHEHVARQESTVSKLKTFASKVGLSQFKVKSFPVLVIVAGVFLLASFYLVQTHNPVTANQDLQQLLQDNGDTPHDKLAYNQSGFAAAPDLPKLLTIRKLGINARVVRLSVRENSEPKFPTNIYDAGWYENSAKPGEDGAALLIGHINGVEKQGIFHDLTNLVPGDEFQLELGDGTIKNFYIVKMEAYDRNNVDFNVLTQSVISGKPGLNLLTAVGAFESNADVVQQLTVFAVEK